MVMMPNPFTPPPEGAPTTVTGAYDQLMQRLDREQIARTQRDVALQTDAPHSVVVAAERALGFCEGETNMGAQAYLDELRFYEEARKTA